MGKSIRKKPTFLLGVGCQKGGTTWLHNYLTKHSECDMGMVKEYHVFDSIFIPECRKFYENKKNEAKEALDKNQRNEIGHELQTFDFLVNPNKYFEYFHYLYLKSNGGISLVGDITPSYSGLQPEALKYIRESMISYGFKPKVLLLLRDPVERCWSAVRMGRRDKIEREPDAKFSLSEKDTILKIIAARKVEIRARYDITFNNLVRVFKEEEILVSFYEELFCDSEIKRITDFLDISYLQANYSLKKNSTSKNNDIGDDVKKAVAEHYSDVYFWAEKMYGREKISGLWESSKYVF